MAKRWDTFQKKISRQRSQKRLDRGFTLLEILITIALVCILLSISIPRQTFIQKQTLTHEIEQLFAIASFLQQKAIASNKNQILSFDSTNRSYTYQTTQTEITRTLSHNVTFGFVPGTKGPPSSPNNPIRQAITFNKQNIIFFPNGQVSPGTVYLQQQKSMKALTCPISQVSFIRKYTYINNRWVTI